MEQLLPFGARELFLVTLRAALTTGEVAEIWVGRYDEEYDWSKMVPP